MVLGVFIGAYYGRARDLRANGGKHYLSYVWQRRRNHAKLWGFVSPTATDLTVAPADSRVLGAPLFYNQQGGAPSDLDSGPSLLRTAQDSGVITMPGLRAWSSRSATLSGTQTNQPALQGVLTVDASGTVTGRITNVSASTLYGVVAQAFGGAAVQIGTLTAGAAATVSLPLGSTAGPRATISQVYGGTAFAPPPNPTLRAGGATRSFSANGLATIGTPLSVMALAAREMSSAGGPIPTNPGETTGQRFQNLAAIALGPAAASSFNSVLAVGWKSTPALSMLVDGLSPTRQDRICSSRSLPVQLALGPFAIPSGAIPGRVAGASQAFQTSFDGSGLTISPNSSAIFIGCLPLPLASAGALQIRSLSISVNSTGAGGTLTSQSGSLWNWASAGWKPINVTAGHVTIKNPGAFINGAGQVRVRLTTQAATLSLSDPNTGIAIGATGVVE